MAPIDSSPSPAQDTWDGFMAFLGEDPLVGLRPHPASSPQHYPNNPHTAPLPTTAAAWAENYNAGRNRVAMEREATEEALLMVEEGLDEEPNPDVVFRVRVDSQGTVSVFDGNGEDPFAVHTARAIYDAFGMPSPF